ncbi:mechanosensitive ion channel family protein [Roseobacter sp. CCS2]|uniref:mechanosensitive ion channel family protein n=1 Tax=Roseobacter sp. CCS2 TaxID=391593 RepID=UPI0012EABE2E|nr:mechanosensitive ion channel family protein [Roseobacter sp. CCS2]
MQAQTVSTETDNTDILAPQTPVEVDPSSSDAAIENRISDIMDATTWYSNVSVSVQEGVVFLDGIAETEARKEWARQLAAKTTGVVAVVNRMTVDDAVVWSFDPAINEIERLARQAVALMPLVVLAVLVLPLAWFAARLVSRMAKAALTTRIQSPFLRTVVARAIAFPVLLLGLYIVLQVAGLTQLAISLVGGAGVLGIVLGFAFRDIAENFLSSLILSVRRPFRRGDFVEVVGIAGTVRSMNTRSTIIASVEGNLIHVPNSIIFKSVIENFTSSPERRGEFTVGIGYDAIVAQAQDVIMKGLASHDAVLTDPAPMVLVDELGASTINIKTYFWFDGLEVSPIKLKSALLRMVKSDLTEAGISMPDEAREVIFPEGVNVQTQVEHVDGSTGSVAALPTPKPPPIEPDHTAGEDDLKSDLLPLETDEDQLEEDANDLLASR